MMLPEPINRTPCSRRLASACPTRVCRAGPPRVGSETCTTGMSACGYINDKGTHTPWSKGRSVSMRAGKSLRFSNWTTSAANCGSPGAGYCTSNNALGKPPKSCQVSGCGLPLTNSSLFSQWAETITMALGFGNSPARRARAGPLAPGSRASMGEPWDIYRLGNMNELLRVKMGVIFSQIIDLNLI
ncbi:hypothetical protein EMIT0P100_130129 [Pseudomonas sp. IT-P100]